MQVTNIPAVVNGSGAVVEQAGVRINYFEDGKPFEAIRRPLGNGMVRCIVRNVTTGEVTVSDVSVASLGAA
jgi:hypothetical protein